MIFFFKFLWTCLKRWKENRTSAGRLSFFFLLFVCFCAFICESFGGDGIWHVYMLIKASRGWSAKLLHVQKGTESIQVPHSWVLVSPFTLNQKYMDYLTMLLHYIFLLTKHVWHRWHNHLAWGGALFVLGSEFYQWEKVQSHCLTCWSLRVCQSANRCDYGASIVDVFTNNLRLPCPFQFLVIDVRMLFIDVIMNLEFSSLPPAFSLSTQSF